MSVPTRGSLIGGEFEMSGPLTLGSYARLRSITRELEGTWVASGRAALVAILASLADRGASRVQLPAYCCRSVVDAAQVAGMEVCFYPVDEQLRAEPDPRPGDVLVSIHYFGWPNEAALALRSIRDDGVHLVEDFSQAMLSDWGDVGAIAEGRAHAFLSARKFGPAPLGGWLSRVFEPGRPSIEIALAAWQSLAARQVRRDYLSSPEAPVDEVIESFYLSAFAAVEAQLDALPRALAAPTFVYDVVAAVDWDEASRRRRANWLALDRMLAGRVTRLVPDLYEGVVPLGYPVLLSEDERDRVRSELARQRIFCPVHWPLPDGVAPGRFPAAARLSRTALTLPIDQRYDDEAMGRLAEALLRARSVR